MKSYTASKNRTDTPKLIILFGPTGVGKTDLLERLFSFRAEVISADALQVYKGLDIGTAKPGAELLSKIPHHLISILDYTENFSAGEFRERADILIPMIIGNGRLPVISGGTAFYIRAWLMGLPETPPVDPVIRVRIEELWKHKSDDEIRGALDIVDPVSARRIGQRDRYRMLRALEVHEQTGGRLSDIAVPETVRTDYQVLLLGLRRDRKELYERINLRVKKMMEDGLEGEVAALRAGGAEPYHPGMKAIGYREWFSGSDLQTVEALIARNTRRYAKRQITFFNSLPDVRWYDAAEDPESSGLCRTVDDFLAD